jgi:hypothetical protein
MGSDANVVVHAPEEEHSELRSIRAGVSDCAAAEVVALRLTIAALRFVVVRMKLRCVQAAWRFRAGEFNECAQERRPGQAIS